MTAALHCNALIVGGGPAGLAAVLAASQRRQLPDLLAGGLVMAERGASIGGGRIGRYAINSDSSAETFLSCVRANPEPRLAAMASSPVAKEIGGYGKGAVPLALVGRFMDALGDTLHEVIEAHPDGHVLTGHEALHTRRLASHGWSTCLRSTRTGQQMQVVSRSVVLATGGHQPEARLEQERVAGRALLPLYRGKLLQSDLALTAAGLTNIRRRLSGIRHPRIVVIGGSTSALACTRLLLTGLRHNFQPGAITLMHRRTLTVFYPSAEAARAENYTEFSPDDICPVSGFVFRFGGLRFDSRELAMQLRGIAGRAPENRVILHRLDAATGASPAESRKALDDADLILCCLGYRPCALPVLDEHGSPVALHADQPGAALVGTQAGILDANGDEIPGLFGIGLAAGFKAHGTMGGEASFRGQMNGLWLWQNDVGALIFQRLLERPAHVPEIIAAPSGTGGLLHSDRRHDPADLAQAADRAHSMREDPCPAA